MMIPISFGDYQNIFIIFFKVVSDFFLLVFYKITKGLQPHAYKANVAYVLLGVNWGRDREEGKHGKKAAGRKNCWFLSKWDLERQSTAEIIREGSGS